MYRRFVYPVFFILLLGLAGSASAAVLYSDTFDRPDSPDLGTNDNVLGGRISAPWVEVEDDETQFRISGNALVAEGGNGCNCYIDHKFTGDELPHSFIIEFDVMPTPLEPVNWFIVEFGPKPESFTTGIDTNKDRVTFGLMMRPRTNFVVWDSGKNIGGPNNSTLIDNSSNPARVKLQIDSPNGYSNGSIATVQMWIDDVLVENFVAGSSSYEFTWEGHTDGLYISFENYRTPNKSIDNLVISCPWSLKDAINPNPENEATDVLREVVLSWEPGELADQHDVFLGTVFDDVHNATTTADPAGIYKGRQSESTYVPGRLDFSQTYFWRVDEVGAPPTSEVLSKGEIWNFTVEPFAYAIEALIATASSENREGEGPENTVNGSGLDDSDLHSVENSDMWLSNAADTNPAWIQYEFDRVCKLHQMLVWNYNSSVEPVVGSGIREATVEYSVDGTNWSLLGTTHEFARGPGAPDYAPNTTIDFGGVAARYVRITANSNWGGIVNQYGLSEVHLLYIPVAARESVPADGATDVDVNVVLDWRAGREAGSHEIYFGTDPNALTSVSSVTEPGFDVSALDLALGQNYYWRIDEVNEAETPTTWQGDIWSFSTPKYLVVDDFEDYNDYPPYEIYTTWVDGYENSANGSQVGYVTAPAVETTIVHGGLQSMPLSYSNTGGAAYSEATRTFTVSQNWTKHAIKTLGLWFFGTPSNTGQLYVKINGVKVSYDGDVGNLALPAWQPWNIDLTTVGVNLQSVTSLAIGIDGNAAAGTLYVDDIRLYAYARQLITPVQPDPAGLAGHWPLDGNFNDSSGNGRNGTPVGGPTFAPGKIGQAISLDGADDYVTITGYKGANADRSDPNNPIQRPFSVACWVNTTENGSLVCWGSSDGTGAGGQYQNFRIDGGRLRAEHGNGRFRGAAVINDGQWHHIAMTVAEGANLSPPGTQLYVDGLKDSQGADTASAQNIWNLTEDADVAFGTRASHGADRLLIGKLDDVYIYERALTSAEIAGLAGRTFPFDEPF